MTSDENLVQREQETLDYADLRIVDMLCSLANSEEDTALRTTLTQLAVVCSEGSLCLPIPPASPEGGIVSNAPRGLGGDEGRYDAILGNAGEAKPLIRHENRLYFHRYFHAERVVGEGLASRLQSLPCDLEATRSVLREILEENPLRSPKSLPLELTQRQKWALAAALRGKVFFLSGGPGTGKTALTASLLRALMRLRGFKPERIRLCAPTGRAAQRLQESLRNSLMSLNGLSDPDARLLQIPVETLHRMLGYHVPTSRFARNQDDPLQADLVLLDEASMADVFILSALVQALPPEAMLILVGDADQLPAVEAGSVLGELSPISRRPSLAVETWQWVAKCFPDDAPDIEEQLPLETVPTVVLDYSHRAQKPLRNFAEAINTGDVETVLQMPRMPAAKEDFAAALPNLLEEFAQFHFMERRLRGRTYVEWLSLARDPAKEEESLSSLMEFQGSERILACTRHGGLGCERINSLLQKDLQPVFETRAGGGRSGIFHGAPLLITRNDARTGLSNGEIGIWLKRGSGFMACFPRGADWLRLPAAFLPAWELAFATTVHKSQGSECDAILLVLPEAGNRLLTREALYTAVTRARASVRLYSSEAALREAVANRVRRHSGLRGYFKGD